MKKIISIILSVMMVMTMLISAVVPAFAAETTDTRIVISTAANKYEIAAAEFLRDTVKASTGTEYKIVYDSSSAAGFEIAVGNTNRLSVDMSAYDDGTYIIRSFAGGVAVVGAGTKGNVYGVCRLLKDYGNYRCYVAGDDFTNDGSALSFPDNINIEYKPFFEYTETDWRLNYTDSTTYSIVNGLNGGAYNRIADEYGGTVKYLGGFAHTLASVFCSRDKYFDSHPEYFALRDGKRTSDQLCLTSEGAFNVVLSEVLQNLAQNASDGKFQIISLTQSDNQSYCECENCKRIDEENGSQAGTMLTFINRIAEQVELAGYTNVAVDTFAYQYTRTPPKVVKPRDNVIVRLCSIECCFSHTFDDATCENNIHFMQDLEGWGKICDRVYVWDYANNYGHSLAIFPDFGVLQRNMQILYENNVKGVYVEGNYYLGDCDGEFGDLRSYLIANLLADPYCDYDKALHEFCNAFYGAAGEQIAEFIYMTIEGSKDNHLSITNHIGKSFSLTRQEIKTADALWDIAKENTANDPTTNARVRRSEISWRLWKSANRKSEFAGFGLVPERLRLYRDITDMGIYRSREGMGDIKMMQYHLVLGHPDRWNKAKKESLTDYTVLMNLCIQIYDTLKSIFAPFIIC